MLPHLFECLDVDTLWSAAFVCRLWYRAASRSAVCLARVRERYRLPFLSSPIVCPLMNHMMRCSVCRRADPSSVRLIKSFGFEQFARLRGEQYCWERATARAARNAFNARAALFQEPVPWVAGPIRLFASSPQNTLDSCAALCCAELCCSARRTACFDGCTHPAADRFAWSRAHAFLVCGIEWRSVVPLQSRKRAARTAATHPVSGQRLCLPFFWRNANR
jgi:hypothetical protein